MLFSTTVRRGGRCMSKSASVATDALFDCTFLLAVAMTSAYKETRAVEKYRPSDPATVDTAAVVKLHGIYARV